MNCAYCTDDAKGFDEDGEPTCGAETCTSVVRAMPRVTEISDDNNEDSGGDCES